MDSSRPCQLGNSSSLCIQSKDNNVITNLYQSLVEHEEVTVLVPLKKIVQTRVFYYTRSVWNC